MAEPNHISETGNARARDAAPANRQAVFARNGEYWTIGYPDRTFHLKHAKGLAYIQLLLRFPGQELHALDFSDDFGVSAAGEATAPQWSGEPHLRTARPGDAGAMLDAQAKQDYRRRLLELTEEHKEQSELGNHAQAYKIESEMEALKGELMRAVGLGGRDRRSGSASERARLNVTRAIKGAIQRISEQDAELGEFLDHALRTGVFCLYLPPARDPIAWRFSLEDQKPAAELAIPAALVPHIETGLPPVLEERTAFVGRQAERAVLRRSLEQALQRSGRIAIIGGAPGVGKSRTAREFADEAAGRGVMTVAGSCYEDQGLVPFVPFVEMLEAVAAHAPTPQAFRETLGRDGAEIARLMPQLRRLFPDVPPPQELSPEQSRRSLFQAFTDLLGRMAQERPMLVLIEDLHWAEEGTLSLLNFLARAISRLPVMVVATYRDTEVDSRGQFAKTLDDLIRLHVVDRIDLLGLPRESVAEMIKALSGHEPPAALVSFMCQSTEGNPFFIEELFRHLVERGKITDSTWSSRWELRPQDIDVPQSLRVVIGRRLARLSAGAREVLDTAAVIGRSFTFELLEACSQADADSLLDWVEEPERAGLISSTLENRETRFQFTHHLIQQAVLAELSVPRERRLHLAVVEAIERMHPANLEDHANDLAHHLWHAGTTAEASKTVRYLAIAARRALAQGAYEDALPHLERGLGLVKSLPDAHESARGELDLQLQHAVALLATKGWYIPEVGNAYQRALELSETLGEESPQFSAALGLWSFYLVRGEHPMARAYSDRMSQLAARVQDPAMLVHSNWAGGCTRFFMGEFAPAHASLERCIQICDSEGPGSLAFPVGHDPHISALCYDAPTLWVLGFPEQAEKRAVQALALARGLGYAFSLTWCLSNLAMYHLIRGAFDQALELIQEGLSLAAENGFEFYEEVLSGYRFIGMISLGRAGELPRRGGRRKFSELPFELSMTWARTAVAEALGSSGKFQAAHALLAEASALMERTQERYYESEILRIGGELILGQMRADNADASAARCAELQAKGKFLKAIEVARERGALAFELRAAISLGRLGLQSGRSDEPQRILKEVCGRFKEGFDEPELRSGQQLLKAFTPRPAGFDERNGR